MKKHQPPHPSTLRMVRAVNADAGSGGRCAGCVYNVNDDCIFDRREHHDKDKYFCHRWKGIDRNEHWIFIEHGEEAQAAYAALILEHGVETD